ncbi:MbtH family protein [Halopseudomonas pelagia]|uniref:MbtH family protein n=1 Tax=Halopseudomonas pelagia TaxID=553151 RepID=UPI00068E04A4
MPSSSGLSLTLYSEHSQGTVDREDTQFLVVINEEQQYSIWPKFKADCLACIEANWSDMHPASLREAMPEIWHRIFVVSRPACYQR